MNLPPKKKVKLKVIDSNGNTSTYTESRLKTSKFKGVSFKACNKVFPWLVRISFKGKIYTLYSFQTEEEAAVAYDLLASSCFKTYQLNKDLYPDEIFPEIDSRSLPRIKYKIEQYIKIFGTSKQS